MATISSARPTTGPSAPQSHPFTCVTCAVAFRSSELQRNHMRSDWHRYNLKRRVATLPPISSEVFAEKVLNAQATKTAEAAKAAFEKTCEACQKIYYSENAFRNHIGSAKHRQRVVLVQRNEGREVVDDDNTSLMSSTVSLGEPLEVSATKDPEAEEEFSEVVNSLRDTTLRQESPVARRPTRPHNSSNDDRPDHPISPTSHNKSASISTAATPALESTSQCLFCNYISPNIKLNVMHMEKFHGMFIPEQQYLEDREGLVKYLHAKIWENFECLSCHKLRSSAAAIQTHMRDTGHCKIAFETEEEQLEIGQFYDFRSTYSDEEPDSDPDSSSINPTATAPPKLGALRKPVESLEMQTNGEVDDGECNGWETDSTVSSIPSDEIGSVMADPNFSKLDRRRHHSHDDPRPHKNIDGFHSHAHSHHAAFLSSDGELRLPSGRVAGHRTFNRFYRQNLHSYPTAEERVQQLLVEDAHPEGQDNVENSDGAPRNRQVVSRANGGLGMVGFSDAMKRKVTERERKDEQKAQQRAQQYVAGVQKRANNQKHFRDPLLQ